MKITTTLTPLNADGINYIVLRKDRAADVYHTTAATRIKWQPGLIVLRCTVASAKVRLLLYVPHAGQTFTF